ncbi:MAG TPA: sigma 54-interacting transcriptional regulator [Treponemataceae bacterium]|jgi:DNA-binding NtrC family response regulator|nr:sigma 54-interacting transcriptional regulator [Treponemataceae bacterium]
MAKVYVLSGNKDFTDFCEASLRCSCKISVILSTAEIKTQELEESHILIVENEYMEMTAEDSMRLHNKGIYILVVMENQKLELIVSLIKNGVHDVIEYPCSTIKLYKRVEKIQRYIEKKERKKIFEGLELNLLEKNKNIEELFHRFSKTDLPILLLGETGTGKSYYAKKIVALSPRKNECFIEVNCSSIPEQLAELEFFGSEKGAFTGAEKTIGFLEKADKGTLFLDEVGELPKVIQAKLLKVLDEGIYYKLGSAIPQKVNIRYLFATNRDLQSSIIEGDFRKDFFNRINAVQFYLPPLKDQRQSINHYINLFSNEIGKSVDDELRLVLNEYEWPGNIRELKNVLKKISQFSEGHEIRLKDLRDFSFC